MKQRLYQKEWMDLGPAYYSSEEYADCLHQLDKIGRYLGGDLATFQAFNQLKAIPQSILDVGCGGGFLTMRLAKKYPQATILGVDISNEAIAFAKAKLGEVNPPLANVQFVHSNGFDCLAEHFDVITSSLVCHHFSDEELIEFMQKAYHSARQAIIINDLHRHSLAILGYKLITLFFFRNRMIRHDGLISIQRGFLRKEWNTYLSLAKIPLKHCSIQWRAAFRWILSIDASKKG